MIIALRSGFLEVVSTFSIFSDCALFHPCLGRPGPASQQKGSLCVEATKEWDGRYIITSVWRKSEESDTVFPFPLI